MPDDWNAWDNHAGTIQMTSTQIERMISRLPASARASLVRKLEAGTWRTRFTKVIAMLRKQAGRVSDPRITRIVEEVRQARYASSRR
ncbi:MAG: hypothetical protein AAB368_17440 [bacterium]